MTGTYAVLAKFGAPDFPLITADLVAVLGIGALTVLGVILVLRNRLGESETVTLESSDGRTEFVTDRERVHRLLQENGGRMKQSEIVDSVDWSKAKVSRLLSDLEADGEITKLSLGRENLISLPGHEPSAAKS